MDTFKTGESLSGNVSLSDWGPMFLYLLIVHELAPFLVKWLNCRATGGKIHESSKFYLHGHICKLWVKMSC